MQIVQVCPGPTLGLNLFFFVVYACEVFTINVFLVMLCNIDLFFHCACIVYRDIKHLESYESTQVKSQGDRPSPKIPHERRANLRVPARVVALRVVQFVLKTVHLAISMEPRGPRSCGLLPRLWLLDLTI